MISVSGDRKLMLELLREYSPVATPSSKWPADAFGSYEPWALRSRSGRFGKDIKIFSPPRNILGSSITVQEEVDNRYSYLWVKWIRRPLELRFHIVNGKSVLAQYKAMEEGAAGIKKLPELSAGKDHIRNRLNGWFLYPLSREALKTLGEVFPDRSWSAVKRSLRESAKRLTQRLGMASLVVDYLVTGEAGSGDFILEINTAPGLDESSVAKYAAALKEAAVTQEAFAQTPEEEEEEIFEDFEEEEEPEQDSFFPDDLRDYDSLRWSAAADDHL
jgi:hypothetical protein